MSHHRLGACARMPNKFMRSNDRGPDDRPDRLELSHVYGRWFNTKATTGEIVKMDLSDQDGRLVVRAFGAAEAEPIDWGSTFATPHSSSLGSRLVTGFVADYDFGFMQTRLAANIKHGILVIQSYNRFLDDSGRLPYFTREFFHQCVTHVPERLLEGAACRMAGDQLTGEPNPDGVDLSHYVGHWINTNVNTKVITDFEIQQRPEGFYFLPRGAGSTADWGAVRVDPHAANVSASRGEAFYAGYDFGFMRMTVAANENQGILILASYNTFDDDSGRSSYFSREFFYRDPSPFAGE